MTVRCQNPLPWNNLRDHFIPAAVMTQLGVRIPCPEITTADQRESESSVETPQHLLLLMFHNTLSFSLHAFGLVWIIHRVTHSFMLCVHHPPTSSSHPQHVQHKRVRQSLENRWASIEEEKKSLLLSPETPVREAFHFMFMPSFVVHCLFFFRSRVVDELVLHSLWGLGVSAGHRIYV